MPFLTKSRLALAALVELHVSSALAAPILWELHGRTRHDGFIALLLICLALLFSQPILLAAWIGLAAAPARIRIPSGIAAGTVIYLAFLLSFQICGQPWRHREALKLLAAGLVPLSLLCGACLLFRRHLGVTLTNSPQSKEEPPPTALGRNQFRLRHLMLWTLGIALALGVGRWLCIASDTSRESHNWRHLALVYTVVSWASLPGLPLIVAVLDKRKHYVWTKLAWLLAFACLLVAAPFALFDSDSTFTLLGFACGGLLFIVMAWGAIWPQLLVLAAGGWRVTLAEPTPLGRAILRHFRWPRRPHRTPRIPRLDSR